MTTAAGHIEDAKDNAEEAVRNVRPWVAALARVGFAAKGVVYIIIGFLAIQGAFSAGGRTTDAEGALQTIHQQPFGRIMLLIAGAGLAGYAAWRLIDALFNPTGSATGTKGLMKRAGRFVSGVAYGSLSLAAFQMVRGTHSGGGGSQDWTARLMSKPMGGWLVEAVGVVVICVGLWQIWRAWKIKLGEKLALGSLHGARRWIIGFGRFGYAARGIVFCMIGTFLIIAAERNNPQEAGGIAQALQSLQTVDYGRWLLAAVAGGLMAYGVFELFEARYRRVEAG
jgi:hypothetical protein